MLCPCYGSATPLARSCYSPVTLLLISRWSPPTLLLISWQSPATLMAVWLSLAVLSSPGPFFGYPVLSWARLGFHELSWAICGSPGLSWGLLGLWLCYCTVFYVFGNALVMTGVMAEPVLAQSAQRCRYRNLHTQLCCSAVTAPLHSRTREDVGKHIYLHPPAAV